MIQIKMMVKVKGYKSDQSDKSDRSDHEKSEQATVAASLSELVVSPHRNLALGCD